MRRMVTTACRVYQQIGRSPGAFIGLHVLILLAVITIVAPWISPHDPYATFVGPPLTPPSRDFLLGTDHLGRDVASRLIYGGRLSLTIGLISSVLSVILGIVVGSISGYLGGIIDSSLMRVVDVWLGFPPLLVALIVVMLLGKGIGTVIVAEGISGAPRIARIVRGQILAVRETTFVESCRAVGVPVWRIITRHIVPNVIGPIIVLGTLQTASAIIGAASLSYLGMGARPPVAEWGLMLNEGREYMRYAWWISVFPGAMLFLTVMSVNLLGDRLRQMLDPRLR